MNLKSDSEIYLNLCAQVYDLRVPFIEEEIYKFFRKFLVEANGSIFEPMCGTGRFLLPFVKEGFDICGCDSSEYMLDRLWKKANAQNLSPNVIHSSIQDFSFDQRFNLIFLPFSSFGLFIEEELVQKVLYKFYSILNFRGKFVFEIDTLSNLSKVGIDSVSSFKISKDESIKVSVKNLPTEQCVLRSVVQYDLERFGEIVYTEIEDYRLRLYDLKKIIALLDGFGFRKIVFHKAFAKGVLPGEYDETVVIEAVK